MKDEADLRTALPAMNMKIKTLLDHVALMEGVNPS